MAIAPLRKLGRIRRIVVSTYQAASGAWVFATGTLSWNWGLDDYGHGYNVVDSRLQRITSNILNQFILPAGPDFTISGSPSSQSIAPGGSTSYGLSVTPSGGFSSAVTFSVSGLPAGATATFTPNPSPSTSSMAITTTGATPNGTYNLTVTGVSGTLTRTTTVTLGVFAPDFALGTLPSSNSVIPRVGHAGGGSGHVLAEPDDGWLDTLRDDRGDHADR